MENLHITIRSATAMLTGLGGDTLAMVAAVNVLLIVGAAVPFVVREFAINVIDPGTQLDSWITLFIKKINKNYNDKFQLIILCKLS